MTPEERTTLKVIHDSLGIPESFLSEPKLPFHGEAKGLSATAVDWQGKKHLLTEATLQAWTKMHTSAQSDGVTLWFDSGFRSFEYQASLIRARLLRGQSTEAILTWLAAPGFSEHHTGRAIDILTPEYPTQTQFFEESNAFCWLQRFAGDFGFTLSYPRDNPYGIVYEPWHWLFDQRK